MVSGTCCITNACLLPVEPTDGRGAGGKGRGARSRNGGPGRLGLSVQETSQRLASIALGLFGHAGIRRAIEAVIRPWIYVQLDRYSGAAQSIRIGQVFFEEEIEITDRNVGWRQARHIRHARSRRIRRDTGQEGFHPVISSGNAPTVAIRGLHYE